MKKKNKKIELLEEGVFGSLFQLHFLQGMFGGGPEGWDPEQDTFLAAQEQLPGLKNMLDKYDGDMEQCARDPKCRSQLGQIMSDMPDELQDATKEAFQKDAGDQLEETETGVLALIKALSTTRTKMLTAEPFKSLDDENKKKALAVFDKVAGAAMRQLGATWQNLLTVIEKNKNDLPDEVRAKVDVSSYTQELQAAMTGGSPGLTEAEPATSSQSDPYNVGSIGGPRYAGMNKADSADAYNIGRLSDIQFEALDPGRQQQDGWEKELFKDISLAMEELEEDVKTLSGYMTDEKSPFGLDREASGQFAGQLSKVIDNIDVALYKRLPNMIARAVGLEKRSASSVSPDFDPNKMNKEDKIKKVRELIATIEDYKRRGEDTAVEAALKAIATIDEKVAEQVAKKYDVSLKEVTVAPDKAPDVSDLPMGTTSQITLTPGPGLKESQKRKFYESLGDFS